MGAQGYWLNERRLRDYPRLFLVVYAGGLLFWFAAYLWDAEQPIGVLRNDFAGFWSVGQMVLEGRAVEAYDRDLAYAAQEAYVPEHELRLPWFYPPQVFFLLGPLGALPYFAAFFLWVGATLACLAAATYALAPNSATPWLLLASPGLFCALRYGQSGVLAAALLGGALFFLARRRQLPAGLLIGLLTLKPQLGVLLPFVLIASGQWRAFAAATATTLVIAATSTLAFGVGVWAPFLEALNLASTMLAEQALPMKLMASLYAPLRTLGLSHQAALWLQALLGVAVLVVVLGVWRRLGADPLSGALLAAGSLLASPYVFGYDLVVFAPAVAILAWDGLQRGWLAGERASYILLWCWPLIADLVGELTGFQIGVAGSLLLFVLAFRRCRAMGGVYPRTTPQTSAADL